MWRYSWLAAMMAFGGMAACSGSTDTTQKDTTGDDDDDDDDDDHSSGGGGSGFDPVAVGFEFDGILMADGTLGSYIYAGTYEIMPSMILSFASLDYFYATTTGAQDSESCFAFGTWGPSPMSKPDQIPVHDGATMYWSYEFPVNLEYSDCMTKVDNSIWGADAVDLLSAFHGARLGVGFGPMTQYLRDAWSQETLDLYGTAMFAEYIALNDKNGTWEGYDWTTGLMFQWDEASGEIVADSSGYLVPVPVNGTPVGGALPQGYVRSFAYWYQDFPLLDLSNLHDGAR